MRARVPLAFLLVGLAIAASSSSSCSCDEEAGLSGLTPSLGVAGPGGEAVTSIDFGVVFLGDPPALRNVVLTNGGSTALRVASVTFEVPGSTGELTASPAEGTIEPGAELALALSYGPVDVGVDAGKLVLVSDDQAQGRVEIPCTGEGRRPPTPEIEVCTTGGCEAPIRADFGAVELGTSGSALVTVKSLGEQGLVVGSVTLEASPSFTVEPASFAGRLEPGTEQLLQVVFRPLSGGPHAGTLTIRSDDPDEPEVVVELAGVGDAPRICPQDLDLAFGELPVGTFATQPAVISNCGTRPLQLSALFQEGSTDFELQLPAAPLTLAAGEELVVEITYRPGELGPDEGYVIVDSDDPASPRIFVTATGTGVAPRSCLLQPSPSVVDFGEVSIGRTSERTLVVSNAGTESCTLGAITEDPGGEVQLVALPPPGTQLPVGGLATIAVRYRPTAAGNASDTIRVASDDPRAPLLVPVQGRATQPQPCELELQPSQQRFGVVPVGQSLRRTVRAVNVGTSACTFLSAGLARGSSPAFQVVTTPRVLTSIAAGQGADIEVEFSPVRATAAGGVLEVEFSAGFALPRTVTASLDGNGDGPALCSQPQAVDFGVLSVGSVAQRSVDLVSCGSQPVVISSLAVLPAGELSLDAGAPAAPLTLAAGASARVPVRYAPVNGGRDDAVLEVHSNDPSLPVLLVPLHGYGAEAEECGSVTGRICAPDGAGFVAGATITAAGPLGPVTTVTDANGWFSLECVAVGSQAVTAAKGSWSTGFTVQVVDRQTTTLPVAECLDPGSADIAVIAGAWDHLEQLLTELGVPNHDLIDVGATYDFLHDRAEMLRYDIIMINCGAEESGSASDPVVHANLQAFVAAGGSLYTTDYAYDFVEQPWPTFVEFNGDDSSVNAAATGAPGRVAATIRDPVLVGQVGRASLSLEMCGPCVVMDSTSDPATVNHVDGDRLADGVTRPLMVSFRPGGAAGGTAAYTVFHNSDQSGADIEIILRYVVFDLL